MGELFKINLIWIAFALPFVLLKPSLLSKPSNMSLFLL